VLVLLVLAPVVLTPPHRLDGDRWGTRARADDLCK
jgi:hypothetical protein